MPYKSGSGSMIAGHETETNYKEEYQFEHCCFVAGSIEGITENIKAINNFLNKILMQADDMHNSSEKKCETLMPGNNRKANQWLTYHKKSCKNQNLDLNNQV